MRRLLGTALTIGVLAALAGCGSDTTDAGNAQDQSPTRAGTSTGSHDYDVAIVSATAVGGRVDPVATPVDDPRALTTFLAQFRKPMALTVRSAVESSVKHNVGRTVYAAVVSVGCDESPGASAVFDGGRVTVTPEKVKDPLPECLAPVTSVAIITES